MDSWTYNPHIAECEECFKPFEDGDEYIGICEDNYHKKCVSNKDLHKYVQVWRDPLRHYTKMLEEAKNAE